MLTNVLSLINYHRFLRGRDTWYVFFLFLGFRLHTDSHHHYFEGRFLVNTLSNFLWLCLQPWDKYVTCALLCNQSTATSVINLLTIFRYLHLLIPDVTYPHVKTLNVTESFQERIFRMKKKMMMMKELCPSSWEDSQQSDRCSVCVTKA